MPRTSCSSSTSGPAVGGTISQYTFDSLKRRAISRLYWEPKSIMTIHWVRAGSGADGLCRPATRSPWAISRYVPTSMSSEVETRWVAGLSGRFGMVWKDVFRWAVVLDSVKLKLN